LETACECIFVWNYDLWASRGAILSDCSGVYLHPLSVGLGSIIAFGLADAIRTTLDLLPFIDQMPERRFAIRLAPCAVIIKLVASHQSSSILIATFFTLRTFWPALA
jgi:hypothetical protein